MSPGIWPSLGSLVTGIAVREQEEKGFLQLLVPVECHLFYLQK